MLTWLLCLGGVAVLGATVLLYGAMVAASRADRIIDRSSENQR